MRSLRSGLIVVTTMALLAPAAGAVVVKSRSGHRVAITLRRGARPHGLSAVRSGARRAHIAKGPGAKGSTGVLVYHGGPVLHSETPYLILWEPGGTHTITANSKSVLAQYLTDASKDSGGTDNVFGVLAQYSDSAGAAAYHQTFASADVIDDTHAYPASSGRGCPLASGMTACVTDAQIQAEITRLISADGLGTGTGVGAPIYFVVTPTDVNVCLSGGSCESNAFCAYHDEFTDANRPVLYASLPFSVWATDPSKGCQEDGTSVYQSPDGTYHGDPAYGVVDNLSHELSETITDPLLNAWFSNNGSEVGDICEAFAAKSNPSRDVSANAYRPTLSGTAAGGDLTDQLFAGDSYYTQTEWSNARADCSATPTT